MRKSKRLLTLVISGCLLFNFATTPAFAEWQENWLNNINLEHRTIKKPTIDFNQYVKDDGSEYTTEDLLQYSSYNQNFDGNTVLTLQQVQNDLAILFEGLKSTYGPYYYFGGDEVFLSAKAAILEDCRQSDPLTAAVLVQSMQKHLSFIQDGHFTINRKSSGRPIVSYLYQTTAFVLKQDGFHRQSDNLLVAAVDGVDNLHKLFGRSISPEGELIYYPVVLAPLAENAKGHPHDLIVHYQDGSTEILSTEDYQSYYDKSEQMVSLHYQEGIPVVFVRNMYFDEAKGDQLGKQFLSYAEQLKNEPVVIVDLRSNGGGNSLLPLKWLEIYAGEKVPTNAIGLKRWTMDDLAAYDENKDNPYYASAATFMAYDPLESFNDNYMLAGVLEDKFIDNNRLLIILTGKNTASAAEVFVDAAHNIANTLVIGDNTYGVGVSNAYTNIILPQTNIAVQLGSDLILYPEDYFPEYVGLKPDIWVKGDAEMLAVKLIKQLKTQS